MKFGICNEMFEGWEFPQVCGFVAEVGYDGIELAPFTFGPRVTEVGKPQREEIAATARGNGLEIIGLHWLLAKTEGLHLTSPDPETRRRTRDYLLDLGRFCSDTGGSVMVFGSPQQRSLEAGQDPVEGWHHAVEVFRSVAPELGRMGVTLCFEPLSPKETNFINTAEEGRRLVDAVGNPAFQLHLDVKAMCSESKSIPEIVRESRECIGHFHANDPNLRGPGMGKLDFAPIGAVLREIGYDRYVSVEVFDLEPGPEATAVESLTTLKKTVA